MNREKLVMLYKEIKKEVGHSWKYHKISSMLFASGIGYFILYMIFATIMFREKYFLPEHIQSGLIAILCGYLIFHIFAKVSTSIKEKEEEEQVRED